jgi:anhydro-N-acetylmuramic acid kinase
LNSCRMKEYLATGIMSGTSLDGMDLAHCAFSEQEGKWSFRLIHAETISYPPEWKSRLRDASLIGGRELLALHAGYGHFIGQTLNQFLLRHNIRDAGIIASHGHTVFHRPDLGYTFQAGSGAAIAAETGRTVVSDFRSLDVALKGQGAPLVPIGDKLLFGDHRFCLNLGGFANISYDLHSRRLAHDICPVNIVLNRLAAMAGPADLPGTSLPPLDYDPDGMLARNGQPDDALLKILGRLPFYAREGPKSLGEEWVNKHIMPLLNQSHLPVMDLLSTWVEHAAAMISAAIPAGETGSMLISGGGAHNVFLVERIRAHLPEGVDVFIPDPLTADFKEAMVFAFMGLLRMLGKINCLASVTGSEKDHSAGSIHTP